MSAAPAGKIGTVILAAGESSRLGQPKQLLEFRGTTLLRHAAQTALAAGGPVCVVLGAFAETIRPTLENLPVLVVENRAWREGMGASLRTGLRALLDAHASLAAVVFLLSDQPFISAEKIRALVAEHERTGRAIVASEYGGSLGVPALFASGLFPELRALAGNEGAKKIISRHRDAVAAVAFHEGIADIDTLADYERLHTHPPS